MPKWFGITHKEHAIALSGGVLVHFIFHGSTVTGIFYLIFYAEESLAFASLERAILDNEE